MRRIINKYIFDYETVFPYFKNHVGCGKTLAKKLLERINFRFGKFYTFLPENIRKDWLYEFSEGIILPDDPFSNPRAITTTDMECSEFVGQFIQKKDNHYAITEDFLIKPEEYKNNIKNVKMTPYKNEVYYLFDNKTSLEEICKAIIRAGEVWHTLIVLTELENGNEITSLNNEIIDEICDNVQYVLAGAYDGDAYIFWERYFNPQKLKLN